MPTIQDRIIRAIQIILSLREAINKLESNHAAYTEYVKKGELNPHSALKYIGDDIRDAKIKPEDLIFALAEADHFRRVARHNETAREYQRRKRRAAREATASAIATATLPPIDQDPYFQQWQRAERERRERERAAQANAAPRANESAAREARVESISPHEARIASESESTANASASATASTSKSDPLAEGTGRVTWIELPPESDPSFAQAVRERERERIAQREAELREAEARQGEPLF